MGLIDWLVGFMYLSHIQLNMNDNPISPHPGNGDESYTQPKDVVGFFNKDIITENSPLTIKKQWNMFKRIESAKIYRSEGKTTENIHPIFSVNILDLYNTYEDLGVDCIGRKASENSSTVTCHTRDMHETCETRFGFAYCDWYQLVYCPTTIHLCHLGERDFSNPDGPLTGKDVFSLWQRHQNLDALRSFRLPNIAIKWFALDKKIANKNTFVKIESDDGVTYSVLPEFLYYKTIEKIEDEHDVEINRPPIHNNSEINNESDPGECTSDTNEQNNNTISHTSEPDLQKKHNSDQSGDELVDDQDPKDDELTKYLTYTRPNLDDDDLDVDRDAVKQFVDEFAEVGGEEDMQMKTACDEMLNLFTEWAKINKIELDKLSEDQAENIRKGKMKNSLSSQFGIEKTRARIDGNRTPLHRPIELSDDIRMLT